MEHRGSNTETLLSSAMHNHTDAPVITPEELKFNQALKSKSPRLDQSSPWCSDEAHPDLRSSLLGDKNIINSNDS